MRKATYFPPIHMANQFHCPLCSVYAAQYWKNLVFLDSRGNSCETSYTMSTCSQCKDVSYWEDDRLINPAVSSVEPPDQDLPESCLEDYKEARDIVSRSPKGAAALLRLCVQKLMVALGESGKNLNDDIASLVKKGLPIQVQQALDYCRVVGNNAVHPLELQLDDKPELAHQLFAMINFIVRDRITRPREMEAFFSGLPEGAHAAIKKRDASKN